MARREAYARHIRALANVLHCRSQTRVRSARGFESGRHATSRAAGPVHRAAGPPNRPPARPANPCRPVCSPTTRCPTSSSATAAPAPARSPASPTASWTTGRGPRSWCPSIRSAAGSGSQRLYSFKDILVLKIVKRLLDTGISLHNIRVAVDHLRQRGVRDLANITLFSDGTTVYECTSAEEVVDLLQGGQGVFGIAVSGAMRELTGAIADFPVSAPTAASRSPRPRTSSRRGASTATARSAEFARTPQLGSDPAQLASDSLPVNSVAHRPCAGEFRDRQPRTPKEQHLSVNLSGTQDRARPRCLWKVVSPGRPAHGERHSRSGSPNLSGTRVTTEGEEPSGS